MQPTGKSVPRSVSATDSGGDQEIICISEQKAIGVWLELQVQNGTMSRVDADRAWKAIDGSARAFVDYFPAAKDAGIAAYIQRDFGKSFGKVRVQTYRGKPHYIFKGRPGLRKIVTGTRYGASNAKLISWGIGKQGLKSSATRGGILSVLLVTAFNVTDYIMNDKATLSQFFANMTVDLGVVAASTGIGLAAGALVAGTAISAIALGPLIVVIGVTVVASLALSYAAEKLKLKEHLTNAIDAAVARANQMIEDTKKAWYQWALDITGDVIDYVIDSFVDYVADQFRRATRRYFGGQQWLILK